MALTADDKLAIAEAKYRYAAAADARDWDLYASLIGDPIVVHFPGMGYDGGPRERSREWWVRQVSTQVSGFALTQHVMSAPLVEEIPDGAALTVNLIAHHRLEADDPDERSLTIGGRYEDRLKRQDGGWVFTALTLYTLWSLGDPAAMTEAYERGRKLSI